MPNCDFFAIGTDHRAVLEYIFSQGTCDVYEGYSPGDHPLRQLQSLSDLEKYFAITDWSNELSGGLHLQLYPHGAKGKFVNRRIALKPKYCQGATFRHAAEGWGLVSLQLERFRKGKLQNSHTNHNSPARAAAWAEVVSELGDPADWDWKCVASFSRKLNRFIHSLAVAKRDSYVVLPAAAELQKQSVPFWGAQAPKIIMLPPKGK